MKQNNISKALGIIGKIIISCGIVFSIVIAIIILSIYDNALIGLISFVIVLMFSVVCGVLLLGVSEIINLLQLNVFKTEKLIQAKSNDSQNY